MSAGSRLVALGAGLAVLLAIATASADAPSAARTRYAFLDPDVTLRALDEAIPAPSGYGRVALPKGSFGRYLRHLPLRLERGPVRAHDGRTLVAPEDARVAAVSAIDVGRADLQQCADSVIRWHAEWLWAEGRARDAAYHFVSGDLASFASYAEGERPVVLGRHVRWERRARPSESRATFRAFLDVVFTYASTLSLAREARPVPRAEVAPGDFFVLPGSPGHAVLILDVAIDAAGRKLALLGQGYMPAQDFHVLASGESGHGPWFSLEADEIATPFWPTPFAWSTLRRFAASSPRPTSR